MTTTYERFLMRCSSPSFRCRIGFHYWGGWIREIERVHTPDAGEGTIKFTVYQWRRCYDCAEGDGAANRDVLCSGTLTPTQAVWRGLLKDSERRTFGTRIPLPDLDFGIRLDSELYMGADRFGPGRQGAVMGLLCRFGFHLYSRGCCLRCAHLGRPYRSWSIFFEGRLS
jgi:hypothetical protein